MAGYGEMAKSMAIRNLGEDRVEEICRQFSLMPEDRKLMDRLWSEWQPDYSLDDIVTLCEKHRDYPNIGRVMQAWESISREAARISTLGASSKDG